MCTLSFIDLSIVILAVIAMIRMIVMVFVIITLIVVITGRSETLTCQPRFTFRVWSFGSIKRPRFAVSWMAELTTHAVRLRIIHPTESAVERLPVCPAIVGAPSLNRTVKQLVEGVFVFLEVDCFPMPHLFSPGC